MPTLEQFFHIMTIFHPTCLFQHTQLVMDNITTYSRSFLNRCDKANMLLQVGAIKTLFVQWIASYFYGNRNNNHNTYHNAKTNIRLLQNPLPNAQKWVWRGPRHWDGCRDVQCNTFDQTEGPKCPHLGSFFTILPSFTQHVCFNIFHWWWAIFIDIVETFTIGVTHIICCCRWNEQTLFVQWIASSYYGNGNNHHNT